VLPVNIQSPAVNLQSSSKQRRKRGINISHQREQDAPNQQIFVQNDRGKSIMKRTRTDVSQAYGIYWCQWDS
jgi:hypothetical protein